MNEKTFGCFPPIVNAPSSLMTPNPLMDVYMAQTMKRGVMRGAKYIVKMEDDECMDPHKLEKLIKTAKHPQYGYFSRFMWNNKVHSTSLQHQTCPNATPKAMSRLELELE